MTVQQPDLAQAAKTSSQQEVVVLDWKTASNTVLNGRGAWFNGGRPTQLVIQSTFSKGEWKRPRNFTFKNWKINGSIRILGVGSSASNAVKRSSFQLGHTERLQAAAPTGITLSDLKIKADGKIPLIVGPGATKVSLRDSTISGHSQSVAVYLDAESADNSIANNTFKIKADRELIAVDGSSSNLITGNTFTNLPWGGVYVYRNCGERGVVRHQKPQNNVISENIFNLNSLKSYWEKNPKNGRQLEYRYGIWLGSREGSRAPDYCDEDKGYRFGSSISNQDFANDNIISGNRRIGSSKGFLLKLSEDLGIGGYNKFIKNDGRNNQIKSNQPLNTSNKREPAPLQFSANSGMLAARATRTQLTEPGALEQNCGCALSSDLGSTLLSTPVA
jgi:hypothetical protein